MKTRQDAWTEENDLLLAETVLRHVREGSTQLNAFEEVGDRLDRTSAACGFRWNSVVRQKYEQALSLSRKHRKQRQRLLGLDQSGKKKILYKPSLPIDFEGFDNNLSVQQSEHTFSESMNNEHSVKNQDSYHEPSDKSTQNFGLSSDYHLSKYDVGSVSKPKLTLENVIEFLQKFKSTETNLVGLQSENERLKLELREIKERNEELQRRLTSVQVSTTSIKEDYETLVNIMNKARKLAMLEEDERATTKFKMDKNGNLEKIAE